MGSSMDTSQLKPQLNINLSSILKIKKEAPLLRKEGAGVVTVL